MSPRTWFDWHEICIIVSERRGKIDGQKTKEKTKNQQEGHPFLQ